MASSKETLEDKVSRWADKLSHSRTWGHARARFDKELNYLQNRHGPEMVALVMLQLEDRDENLARAAYSELTWSLPVLPKGMRVVNQVHDSVIIEVDPDFWKKGEK